MDIWVDAQLPPSISNWLEVTFNVSANAVRDLGLRDAEDHALFIAARRSGTVIMTKDRDFLDLVRILGAPSQVLWITCGNTANSRLQEILTAGFAAARELLEFGEPIVEISDSQPHIA